MNNQESLIGKRFTRLEVLDEYSRNWYKYLMCKCDCGKIFETRRDAVIKERTKSCGCYRMNILNGTKGINHHNKKFNKYVFHESFVEGITSKGESFFFDSIYYDLVKDMMWTIGADGYAISISDGKTIRMHRVLMSQIYDLTEKIVDHIDGNKVNNRIENMRVCTAQQNSFNHNLHKSNKSGINGVYWDKRINKWVARAKLNYKNIWIGYYDNLEDAAKARREWEIENFKEYSPFMSGREVNYV